MPRSSPSYQSPLAKQAREISEERKKIAMVQADKNRPNSTARGYNRQWAKYRLAFLNENPLCVECERNDILETAEVVDHIVPHNGCKKLFWDKSNHQALCKSCHSRKTAKYDGGFGHRKREGESNPYTTPKENL